MHIPQKTKLGGELNMRHQSWWCAFDSR